MKLLRAATAAFFCAAIYIGWLAPRVAHADPSGPQQAYCTPPNTIQNGPTHPLDANPVQTDFVYGAKCPGQVGDIFFDGAFASPSFSYTGGSLNFTVPANVWVAGGARVHTISQAFTATASVTNYLYLSTNADEGTWTLSTSATPPANTVLEYTIVASGSGITSVTNPPYAAWKILGTLSAGDLTALNQAGHAGYCVFYDVNGKQYGSPCPSPTPMPSPTATATACGAAVSVTGGNQVNVPVCPTASAGPSLPLSVANGGTGTAAPAPTATATACGAPVSITGSFPSQQVNVPVCPTPSPSPTYTPYDTTILAESSLQDYYLLNDSGAFGSGGCPATFADSKGSNALTTPSPNPTGLQCNSVALTGDGEGSLYLPGTTTDYVQVPVAVMPSSSPSPAAWTIEFVQRFPGATNDATLFYEDSHTTIDFKTSCHAGTTQLTASLGGTGVNAGGQGVCVQAGPVLVDETWTAPSTFKAYANGILVLTSSAAPTNGNGTVGAIGHDFNTTANFGVGNFSKFAVYTSALTQAKIYAHYKAMKCGGNYVGTCSL